MAKNKNGFVLYADYIHMVRKLPRELRGDLFELILAYVNDENPSTDDLVLSIAFEPIKQQLKRDLKKFEAIKEKRSEYGRAGGLKSGEAKQSKTKQTVANESKPKQTEANKAVIENDSVTVTDTVNVNVTVNDTLKKENNLIEIFFKDLENSPQLETIAMNHQISLDYVKQKIPEFRKKAELSYPTPGRFISHFKNFINTELTKKTNYVNNSQKNVGPTFKPGGAGAL